MGELKNRSRLSVSVKNELNTAFDILHKKTRIPKSRLADEALELLLNLHGIEWEKKDD